MENQSIYLQMQMDKKDVQIEIEKINNYLSDFLWMDFDYKNIGENKIILCGCLDQSWREEYIEIIFEYPQLISTPFFWSMNEKKPFIQLLTQEDLSKFSKFVSEKGCYIFKLNDCDIDDDGGIFITAARVKCNIIKQK